MAEFLVVYGTLVCGLARSEPQVPGRQGATPPGRACQGRQVRFGICGVRLLTPARLLTARLAAAAAPAARARGSATPVARSREVMEGQRLRQEGAACVEGLFRLHHQMRRLGSSESPGSSESSDSESVAGFALSPGATDSRPWLQASASIELHTRLH